MHFLLKTQSVHGSKFHTFLGDGVHIIQKSILYRTALTNAL